ncbi:hypothetical protein CR513_28239, partial [Mucuna pruriens]
MGWCTESPQHSTPKQMAKSKIGAATLRTRFGHIRQHTELRWECLPTRLFSAKLVTYQLN